MSEKSILIVDDDDDYVASIKLVLEAQGYAVRHAATAGDAISTIEMGMPDLIIMDVMLKQICDGFDLSRKLKRDTKYKKIPILMLTAVGEKTGFQYSPEGGDRSWLPIEGYLTKPVASDELLARIKALLTPRS